MTAAHAADPKATQHWNLLIQNGLPRHCELQIEKTKLPCEHAWYILYDEGAEKSLQFNRGDSPDNVAFYTTLSSDKPDTVTVNVVLIGQQQYDGAKGLCLLGKEIVQCQALLPDGRLVVARITP